MVGGFPVQLVMPVISLGAIFVIIALIHLIVSVSSRKDVKAARKVFLIGAVCVAILCVMLVAASMLDMADGSKFRQPQIVPAIAPPAPHRVVGVFFCIKKMLYFFYVFFGLIV